MELPTIGFLKSDKDASDVFISCWYQPQPDKAEKKGKSDAQSLATSPERCGKSSKGDPIDALIKGLKHFKGALKESSILHAVACSAHPNTILLGVGPKDKWNGEVARQSGAAAYYAQQLGYFSSATVDISGFSGGKKGRDSEDAIQAFCEGYLLASYTYDQLKKADPSAPPRPKELKLFGADKSKALESAVAKAEKLVMAVNFARSLGDRPANHLTPTILAELLQKMSKEVGVKCTVFDRARIEKEKMGLFLGVSRGSHEEPKFIVMEHSKGKKSSPPICLIGKGITFDSGGISLKPSQSMEEMKYDMMGAATVAGIMRAVGALQLPINVVGIIAACENMPGSKATKPGDVHFSSSGKSVEITNTDAEGRLILGDALEYAQSLKPQAMIDYATLTGAVIIALGTVCTGVMGNNEKLIKSLKDSASTTGEKVWQLPLFDEYKELMKSNVADIKNSSDAREAGSSLGGIFLKFFVSDEVPWVHCDIAGSGMHRSDLNYAQKRFAPGILIRTTTHLLENWKPV